MEVINWLRFVFMFFFRVAGVVDIMHGLSRMTLDARIPTMPGRSKYVRIEQTLLAPSAKRCGVLGVSREVGVAPYLKPLERRTCIYG